MQVRSSVPSLAVDSTRSQDTRRPNSFSFSFSFFTEKFHFKSWMTQVSGLLLLLKFLLSQSFLFANWIVSDLRQKRGIFQPSSVLGLSMLQTDQAPERAQWSKLPNSGAQGRSLAEDFHAFASLLEFVFGTLCTVAAESVENSSMCRFENDGFCHTLGSAMSHGVHRPPELGRSPQCGLLNS